MFAIDLAQEARSELLAMRAFDRERIPDAIEEQLRHEPAKAHANRKKLEPRPELSALGPVWELRVGDHRVFYRVLEDEARVLVLKVALKGRKATKEIL